MKIDWKLLRERKLQLTLLANEPSLAVSQVETLDGVLNLLDAIQNEAISSGLADDLTVFGQTQYTVFCRQTNREGTTWISIVDAETPAQAQTFGIEACAADWGADSEDGEFEHSIECFCVLEGNVKVALFED